MKRRPVLFAIGLFAFACAVVFVSFLANRAPIESAEQAVISRAEELSREHFDVYRGRLPASQPAGIENQERSRWNAVEFVLFSGQPEPVLFAFCDVGSGVCVYHVATYKKTSPQSAWYLSHIVGRGFSMFALPKRITALDSKTVEFVVGNKDRIMGDPGPMIRIRYEP